MRRLACACILSRMASRSSQFRAYAQKSREAAGASHTSEARDLLLEIANHWDTLADLVESAEALLDNPDRTGPDTPN